MGRSRGTMVGLALALTAMLLSGCGGPPREAGAGAGTAAAADGTDATRTAEATGGTGPDQTSDTCEPNPVANGFCFLTLPKIYCCSAGYLGWSEIVVGSEIALKGRVIMNPGDPSARPVRGLRLVFPSGRELSIPVGPDGSFARAVRFDEEGVHRLYRVTGDAALDGGDLGLPFEAAYRVDTLDAPTVQSVFGPQHSDMQANRVVAVPLGKPAQFRARFVDAAGNPVHNRTLAGKTRALGDVTTNADGVASITFEPSRDLDRYDLQPIYPGLAVLSYTIVEGGGNGSLTGLAGGALKGIREDGVWYYPLGAFLQKAYPLRFAGGIQPDGSAIDLAYGSVKLTTEETDRPAGQVLDRNGQVLFEVKMINRQDGPWLDLPSLARLMDILAWGRLLDDGRMFIAAPEIP